MMHQTTAPRPNHSSNTAIIIGLVDGRYRLLERIGEGGSGTVFKAQDQKTGQQVAIKMLHPSVCQEPMLVRRFEREVELAMNMSQRHTVQVFAKGSYQPNPRHRPQPYMVMELLKGESLEAYIARRGCLSVGETLDILAPVLDALYWAHSAGIVHRDLKPSNVFILNESGQPKPAVKLLDFGLAKATVAWDDTNREDVTVVGALSGTPAYMPPEQFLGLDQTTPASDIYAIGCIAYHMLTGQPPFEESGTFKLFNAHLFTPPPPLDGPLASHPIEPILHKAMAKKAHHRFSDVLELLQAILDLRTASDEDTLAAKALADPYPLHRPIASTHNHITSNEHPIHHTTSSNTLHRPKTPHRWIQLLSGWALRTLGTRSTPHRP